MEQGDDHPQTSRQVRFVSPRASLTQPGVQGMVEAGVFFTAFQGYEWYLDLRMLAPTYIL